MKIAKYTHKAFDGVKTIKGWVLENNYGEKDAFFQNLIGEKSVWQIIVEKV